MFVLRIARVKFMDLPQTDAIKNAMELLYNLGALNWHGKLTKVGTQMAKFPLDPMLSRMIVASDKSVLMK